jgi:type VI secretion system protein ImpH
MATPGGRPTDSLIDALRRDPERFELIQAVRILERSAVLDAEQGRSANAARVGGDADPRDEAVLLRATLELAFPASEVTGYDDSGTHRVVDSSVLGLIGPSGALPAHYSELVLAASRGKNAAMVDFLDMFNHRALSFLVRATEKYRPQMLFELTGGDASDAFSATLYGLIGLLDPTLRGRQAAPDTTLAFYAGHYAHRPRTAGALASLLSEYFESDIRIIQFQGSWSSLDVQEQSRLRQGLGSFSQLGVDAVCGSMIYDVQNGFRLVLGPLDWEQFVAFMPGTPRMAELIALTRSFVDVANLFDVQLMLKGDQIPPLQLSRSSAAGGRVGWNTWLPSSGPRSDAMDAVFHTCD